MKLFLKYLMLTIVLLSTLVGNQTQAQDNSKLSIDGYTMLDYDDFDKGFNEDETRSTNKLDFRRARLALKGSFLDHYKVKLQTGFAGGEIKIKDAYAKYTGWHWAELILGHQKEPFGLEKLTSSRNLLMIERSVVSEGLAPGRSIGIALASEYSSIEWKLGYFVPEPSHSTSAFTGRLSWTPVDTKKHLLHLGSAFSERSLKGSEFRINERMEVYFSDSLIEGKKLNADSNSLQSLEALWQFNSLTTMAEWQQSQVKDPSKGSFEYNGGYVQLGYLLSGENRKYKNSTLGSIKGAGWELSSRYSFFDLVKEQQQVKILSLGVNYFATDKLKLMANVIKAGRTIKGIELKTNYAFSLRVQYSFDLFTVTNEVRN